jgi:hypothetical protein
MMTRLAVWTMCVAALCGCGKKSPAITKSSLAPPADAYQAIGRLPDWSGVWVLHHGQEAGRDATGAGAMSLTPKYQALQAAARDQHAQANLASCLPAGATAVLQHGILYEFLFTPGRVTLLFEDGEVRRIHTDGRGHQPLDELSHSFMGDSIGHWEGHTLVVDTIGFPYGELWQNYGVRATRDTHLVERITLNGQDRIQIDNVISDPAIFASPYAYSREYQRTELPLTEPVCAQNNRDTGTDIDLTPPAE